MSVWPSISTVSLIAGVTSGETLPPMMSSVRRVSGMSVPGRRSSRARKTKPVKLWRVSVGSCSRRRVRVVNRGGGLDENAGAKVSSIAEGVGDEGTDVKAEDVRQWRNP